MKKNDNEPWLGEFLEPVLSALNTEAARKILSLKANRKIQSRVSKLAGKCNEGTLTPEERREYELFIMADNIIALIRAQARIVLTHKSQSA
jgi:hypothetical protein